MAILADSQADDVVKMRSALLALLSGERELNCGAAGTVLRFLAPRAARETGRFVIRGGPRLFSRPQQELFSLLGQLGGVCELREDHLDLRSWGWKRVGDGLHVPSQRSSQFASGALLSAWGLDFPLYLTLVGDLVSKSYLAMTVELLRQAGMNLEWNRNEIFVPPRQKPELFTVEVEPDMSSAFAVAACAAVSGRVKLTRFPAQSLQPDRRFVDLLKIMAVPVTESNNQLSVEPTERLRPIEADLREAPDLFPVMAALAALAEGRSRLFGAPHLAYKESHRLERMAELITRLGRKVEIVGDQLTIFGDSRVLGKETVTFNPDQDHRLAMAAAVLKKFGEPIQIENPEVVQKSFPEFWQIIGEAS